MQEDLPTPFFLFLTYSTLLPQAFLRTHPQCVSELIGLFISNLSLSLLSLPLPGTVLVTPCCIGLSDIKVAQTEERVRVDLHPSSQNKSSVAATTKTGKDTPTATQAKPTRSQRWVPPSARENLDPTEVIFRKVRG